MLVAPCHPDPAPSVVIHAAQARLLARLDRLAPGDEPDVEDGERYEFGEVFAVGGLGVIRRAFDRRLGREVAIKTLRRSDPAAARRFASEARITARLQHPAIVPLHDVGRSAGGEPYYCMKLVDGESLERVIAGEPTMRGRLALIEHVLAAADAIAYAHQRGVLHRDIKPANILVGAHGETVVIDWGLAKDMHEASADEAAADAASGEEPAEVTIAGAIVGTLRYMPPEQARGEAVDARCDVYALGAVLFHVIAGRPPHAGLERCALLERVIAGEVEDLRPLAVGAPRELVAIAQKAMSPGPGDRYPGAAALADDLRRFLAGRLVDAHHYQAGELVRLWLRRHRVLVTAIAASLAALTVASIVYLQRVEAARARAEAAEAEALRRADAAVLAQARGVVDEDPAEALRLLRQVELADPLDVRRARLVAVAAVARGAPDRVLRGHARSIEGVAPLADGGLISVDAGGAVWRWNLRTGRGEQVIDLQAPFGTVVAAAEAPVWAAMAGKHGVLARDEQPLEALDLSGLPLGHGTHRWELSRGGETLAALGTFMRVGWAEPAAAYAWDLRARPARLAELPFEHVHSAAMSPDGRTIAVTGADHRALLVEGEASTRVPELRTPSGFSPSGRYVLDGAIAWSRADGTTRPIVGRLLAITPEDRALVNRRNPNHGPWSDDPQLVLFDLATGEERWQRDLYRSSAQLHAFANLDGGFVAAGDRFAVRHDGRWTLWSMATGKVVRILDGAGSGRAAFLADGRFVATHNRDLWVWAPESLPDDSRDRWLAAAPDDSHALVFRAGERGARSIVRTGDGRVTRLECPITLNWRVRSGEPRQIAVDGRGRALVAGRTRGACLVDADGVSHVLAEDERVVAVALAERSDTFALGLADGTVLAFPDGARAPIRWQLDAEVHALWATLEGGDLIAHTAPGSVFALRLDDAGVVPLGRVEAPRDGVAPAVALDPRGRGAAIALHGADTLALYDDGAAHRRTVPLPVGARLAFSPSGERLAVALAGQGVLVIAGPDDPGRELAVPEAIEALSFVDEHELDLVGELDSRMRLDTALGETIVLQPEHNLRSLGLGLRVAARGHAREDEAVPRDRDALKAWLAARAD